MEQFFDQDSAKAKGATLSFSVYSFQFFLEFKTFIKIFIYRVKMLQKGAKTLKRFAQILCPKWLLLPHCCDFTMGPIQRPRRMRIPPSVSLDVFGAKREDHGSSLSVAPAPGQEVRDGVGGQKRRRLKKKIHRSSISLPLL